MAKTTKRPPRKPKDRKGLRSVGAGEKKPAPARKPRGSRKPPEEELVGNDGDQRRLPGQERRRIGKIETAARAYKKLEAEKKKLLGELEGARNTLIYLIREAKLPDAYDVAGVQVEILTSDRVKVEVEEEGQEAGA